MSHNTLPTDEDVSKLLKLSRVYNTDKCIAKWLWAVDRYREVSNYEKLFESIPKVVELENFLCKFLVWLKRIDEKNIKLKVSEKYALNNGPEQYEEYSSMDYSSY